MDRSVEHAHFQDRMRGQARADSSDQVPGPRWPGPAARTSRFKVLGSKVQGSRVGVSGAQSSRAGAVAQFAPSPGRGLESIIRCMPHAVR
eukprot:9033111-Alexandrium_andersonii.AAC.1